MKYLVVIKFCKFDLVRNVVGRIDEVNQQRARLELEWVTADR